MTASPTTRGSPRSAPRAGCCSRAAALPGQGLVLASAERADLLVDFSDLSPGVELTWLNNAAAPFDGSVRRPRHGRYPDLEGLLPYPEVLRFRVAEGRRASRPGAPQTSGDRLRADPRDELAGSVVRAVALVEQKVERRRAADADPARGRRGPGCRRARHTARRTAGGRQRTRRGGEPSRPASRTPSPSSRPSGSRRSGESST